MPRNANTNARGARFYTWGRGERYWSVTTILSALPKDALKFWAAKSVAEFAVDRSATWMTMARDEAVDWLKKEPLRYTASRADVGSRIHAAAEAYVLQKPIKGGDFVDEERKAMGHFVGWVETLGVKFVAAEFSVYNRTQRYAGTGDAIVEITYPKLLELAGGNANLIPETWPTDRPIRLLMDWKTGGSIEEEKGVYPEVALQLAAYARAEFLGMPNGTEEPLPEVDGTAVLHVNAGGWRFVPVDALRPDVFQTFLYVREVFRWREVLSKEVLGTALALAPPEIAEAHRAPARRPAEEVGA